MLACVTAGCGLKEVAPALAINGVSAYEKEDAVTFSTAVAFSSAVWWAVMVQLDEKDLVEPQPTTLQPAAMTN